MKKFISLLISLSLGMGVCAFGATGAEAEAEVFKDAGISYVDGMESFDTNPGRGWAPYKWYTLRKDGELSESVTSFTTGLYCPMFNLAQFSAGNDRVQEGYDSVYPGNANLVGGTDMDIGENALAAIEETFAAAEAQGVQLIPRFGYTPLHMVGSEPSELKWILRHIEQVSEIINKYKNTVIAVNCGMIGPWGEMHSSNYENKPDSNAVIEAWLTNLDESIPLQTRTAGFILKYSNTTDIKLMRQLPFTKDHPAYRIGMYNDGYLGTAWDYGTWGAGTLTREKGIKLLNSQASRIAYGGELAYATYDVIVGGESGDGRSPIYENEFVKELYDTHLQYLHNIVDGPVLCQELEKLTFKERYAFDGMPDVSCYYGQSLRKFMHDHMGYRFIIRSAQTTVTADKGDYVKLRGAVENVGFGNLLAPVTAELVIVGSDGSTVYTDCNIDPQKWLSCTTNDYAITLSVPKAAEAGQYKVYLRLGTLSAAEAVSGSPTIRFANGDTWNRALGANYIGSFTVTDNVGGYAQDFKQISVDFTDVSDTFWGKDAIKEICTMGLMKGLSDTTFGPNNTTTRGQFVTVLYNMEGQPDTAGITTPFNDVATGKYYTDPVAWAYNNDIVEGTTATTFSPDKKITREQFATMLYRYAKYKGVDTSNSVSLDKYVDQDSVGGWALEAMKWANAEGYITGVTATELRPKNNATRAQMATIMMRYIKNVNS